MDVLCAIVVCGFQYMVPDVVWVWNSRACCSTDHMDYNFFVLYVYSSSGYER